MGRPKLYTDEELREHHIAQMAAYRLTDGYQASQAKYRSSEKRRAVSHRHWTKMAETNPDRQRAYNAVHRALRAGILTKPNLCEKCSSARRVHAHHPFGYTREHRLTVVWLCRPCHQQEPH